MSSCHQCNAPNAVEIAIAHGSETTKMWCVSCWNAHAAVLYADCVIEVEEYCDGDCEPQECCHLCEDNDEAEGYDTEEEEAMAAQTGDTSYLEAHLKAKEDQKKKEDDKTK
tara:strand:+ start:522 stop:854 length:333 start_codon:yes stop_codon:yes gene_type:complete